MLRNAGPQGGPGMPEWGMLPMPRKLLKQGHRDMLRLSDARMSGTSYGACVLHVSPESWVGGPLALLRTGDVVTLDVDARAIRMEVDDAELSRRRAAWTPPPRRYERGYGVMFSQHIQQANEGCDFDFLRTDPRCPGARTRHLLGPRCHRDDARRAIRDPAPPPAPWARRSSRRRRGSSPTSAKRRPARPSLQSRAGRARWSLGQGSWVGAKTAVDRVPHTGLELERVCLTLGRHRQASMGHDLMAVLGGVAMAR